MKKIIASFIMFVLIFGNFLTDNGVYASVYVGNNHELEEKIACDRTMTIDPNVHVWGSGTGWADIGLSGYYDGTGIAVIGTGVDIYVKDGDVLYRQYQNICINIINDVNGHPKPVVPKVETKTEIKKETIKFKEIKQNDNSLAKGTTKVTQSGKNGTLEIVYTVTYTDGKETKREKTSEKITVQPVDQIVKIGTYVAPPSNVKPSSPKVENKEQEQKVQGNVSGEIKSNNTEGSLKTVEKDNIVLIDNKSTVKKEEDNNENKPDDSVDELLNDEADTELNDNSVNYEENNDDVEGKKNKKTFVIFSIVVASGLLLGLGLWQYLNFTKRKK